MDTVTGFIIDSLNDIRELFVKMTENAEHESLHRALQKHSLKALQVNSCVGLCVSVCVCVCLCVCVTLSRSQLKATDPVGPVLSNFTSFLSHTHTCDAHSDELIEQRYKQSSY